MGLASYHFDLSATYSNLDFVTPQSAAVGIGFLSFASLVAPHWEVGIVCDEQSLETDFPRFSYWEDFGYEQALS